MAERLRKVAEQLAAGRVDLLGEQTDVVGVTRRALERCPGTPDVAGQGQRLCQPEGTEQERPLGALESILAQIAVDKAVLIG